MDIRYWHVRRLTDPMNRWRLPPGRGPVMRLGTPQLDERDRFTYCESRIGIHLGDPPHGKFFEAQWLRRWGGTFGYRGYMRLKLVVKYDNVGRLMPSTAVLYRSIWSSRYRPAGKSYRKRDRRRWTDWEEVANRYGWLSGPIVFDRVTLCFTDLPEIVQIALDSMNLQRPA